MVVVGDIVGDEQETFTTVPVGLIQETKGLNSRYELQPLFSSR